MECYICHEMVPHYDYRNHVASHLAGGVTGNSHLMSDVSDINSGYDSDDYSDYSYEEYDSGDHDTTSTLPSALSRMAPATSSPTPVIRSTPNAFQSWLQNLKSDFPEYTTIDGQRKTNSDSEAEEFIQNANFLRDTSKKEVARIVKEFKGFSVSERQACLELVRKVPIFPGLVAYVYTHLVKCPRRWFDWSDRVPDLKHLVEQWIEDDDITCILSCDMKKKRLVKFLRGPEGSSDKHKCSPELLNEMAMLNCDTRNLAALAAICITESEKRRSLLQHDNEAERLVELFHSLLEALELKTSGCEVATACEEDDKDGRTTTRVHIPKERYRRCFFNALVRFSKECGTCPRGIYFADRSIGGLVRQDEGGFGEVFQGNIGSRLVAVKVLKRGRSEYKKELTKEAVVWRHLHHPNCLPLYGVYEMSATGYIDVALVSPWMKRGTLTEYLKQNPTANRTRLILDVVRGLNYLHSMEPHIAHRDIKPKNILITEKEHACLADFGLASVFDVDEDFQTAVDQLAIGGTPSYMAPEMFRAQNKDTKRRLNRRACDMYALGYTIYEVYMGDLSMLDPMSNQPPVKISADMWSFIQNLCGEDPLKRLTAEMAVSWMEEKARQEGTDASPAPFEDEWEWRGPSSDQCLWSV